MTGLHHVGIAVERLADACRFYRDVLGLPLVKEAEIADQGVRAALLAAGDSEIELLEPIGGASGMARFIARHGEGLHHVCFETPDVARELTAAKDKGAELIDATPRDGLAGRIGFLHPRACAGVLVELATPFGAASRHDSPLRLARLVIGAKDPRDTAAVFQRVFAFPELGSGDAGRALLRVGPGALSIVPVAEAGGLEGMAALDMIATDVDAVRAAVAAAPTTHGVPLHITRDQ
ncbi:MAG: methylmalonyl-CoA epimerase [Candidatus Rokubacteria bacterium]|nr:methylmalonyl-CoA epimerase [Candidatus Rokubacteria bacterium]